VGFFGGLHGANHCETSLLQHLTQSETLAWAVFDNENPQHFRKLIGDTHGDNYLSINCGFFAGNNRA